MFFLQIVVELDFSTRLKIKQFLVTIEESDADIVYNL